jgi:hypothetical protein
MGRLHPKHLVVSLGVALAASLAIAMPAFGGEPLPRIYSTVVLHGETSSEVFAIRPRMIVVDSADGGELRIKWTKWTGSSAAGYGRAYPDHGSYPIQVRAGDVSGGVLTRLTITARIGGRTYPPDRLELATDGYSLTWARIEWVDRPKESGLTPWRG